MLVESDPQSHFGDLPFAAFTFDGNHPLLRLQRAIHWHALTTALAPFYSPDQGRPSAPLRVQAAVLLLKFIHNISDRAAVAYAKENIYAQRFCGLTPAQAAGLAMHPASALANLRRRIGPQGLALLRELLDAASKGKSYRKADTLILDTTCVPLDILYPTDIRLLDRCRREILRLFKRAKTFGLKTLYRTYARASGSAAGERPLEPPAKSSSPSPNSPSPLSKYVAAPTKNCFSSSVETIHSSAISTPSPPAPLDDGAPKTRTPTASLKI